MQNICLLGATGSIGQSTLDVLARHPERFRLQAVSANSSVDRMLEICRKHRPRIAVMADAEAADRLADALDGEDIEIRSGEQALVDIAADAEVDTVMAAIVGAVGLMPTLAAVRAGKRVLLANKEALVMAGQLFMNAVRDSGAELLPIDSEHNAIFQCLPNGQTRGLKQRGVSRIWLTGSGGPFREWPLDRFDSITPEQAIAHPNWSMGPKISVDSATMMNKGLELIEACWLFDLPESEIEILLHPQSIIHSMVAYNDGSVLAQLGNPDMRTPIAHALGYPDRLESGVEPLDPVAVSQLNFEAADENRFPCLRLARAAIAEGGTRPAILNAANEIAVDAFLNGRIAFTRIPQLIEDCMQHIDSHPGDSLERILADDRAARERVRQRIAEGLA